MPADHAGKKRHWQADVFETLLRWADCLSARFGGPQRAAPHLLTGKRGEDAAFFHLQRQGYVVVARNWRTRGIRGEIDLVGWHNGCLCFIEVKTRSERGSIAAEFAVNRKKRVMIRTMARAYLRSHLGKSGRAPVRFDILSIYMIAGRPPEFELHPGAFHWQGDKPRRW